MELELTAEERESGMPSPATVAAGVAAIRDDGYVVLKNVVSLEHLDILHERMRTDLATILARPDAPYQFNKGNVQQDPPPFPPFLFRDILVNEYVIGISREVLGPGLKNNFYSGNTALPGGTRQPVHPDSAQLWDGLEVATPAYGLVVNVPVVSMSPHNGSTEFWPGTHLDTRYSIHQGSPRVAEEHLEEWRRKRPPFQPVVERGSAIVRDIRMWHAGMPNLSTQPRPMLAMIHYAGWWNEEGKIAFPQSARPFLEHKLLRTMAAFTDGEVDYLHHHGAYDLEK